MKSKKNITVYDILIYITLIIVVVIILYPLLHVTAVSFSSTKHIFMNDISIYPKGFKPKLKLDLLREIKAKVKIPLVLHGGSANPDSEIAENLKELDGYPLPK